jgi:hypothetical protein
MMNSSSARNLTEIEKVQNPALGAYLLWQYGIEYQNQTSNDSSNFLLYFVVLPICFHRKTLERVNSTQKRSGLGKFCEKFEHDREELFAIHVRTLRYRKLTIDSIILGVNAGLLTIDYRSGRVRANNVNAPKLPDRIKPQSKAARLLGFWFNTLEPHYIFRALHIKA